MCVRVRVRVRVCVCVFMQNIMNVYHSEQTITFRFFNMGQSMVCSIYHKLVDNKKGILILLTSLTSPTHGFKLREKNKAKLN